MEDSEFADIGPDNFGLMMLDFSRWWILNYCPAVGITSFALKLLPSHGALSEIFLVFTIIMFANFIALSVGLRFRLIADYRIKARKSRPGSGTLWGLAGASCGLTAAFVGVSIALSISS